MTTDVGIRIGIEGEKEFKSALSGINSQLKALDSEMKAVTQAFDGMEDSEEAVKSKSDVLTRTLAVQGQKMELLQGQYERAKSKLDDLGRELDDAKRKFGDNSKEAQKLQNAYNKQVAEVNKLSSQINTTTANMVKMEREMAGLGNSADDMSQALDDAEKSVGGFGGTLKQAFVGGAVAGAVQSIISSLGGIVDASREYQKIMGVLETSSEQAGYTAEETAESYNKLYGIIGDSQQSATALANLQAVGLSQEELMRLVDLTTGAWLKYGDSIPIDSLAESINETIKVGQVTGTFADALNWAGISEDEFNEKLQNATSELERSNLVMEALASQGLADLTETYRENNAELIAMQEAEAKLQEGTSDLANVLLPLFITSKEIMAEVLVAIVGLINNIQLFLPLIATIGTAIVGLSLPTLTTTIASLTGGVGVLKAGMMALFTVLKANPIGAVITLIASFTAGIVTAYHTNEEFRNKVNEVWNTIKNTVISNVNALVSAVKTLPALFREAGANMFNSLKEGMASVWNSVYSWVQDKVNWLVNKLAFWRSGQAEMSSGSGYDGSHFSGLSYVPYDGYIAQLHKGERVLTAGENRSYNSNLNKNVQNVFNVSATIREESDIKRVAQELYNLQRNDARGMGVVFV